MVALEHYVKVYGVLYSGSRIRVRGAALRTAARNATFTLSSNGTLRAGAAWADSVVGRGQR
jgi:hypothetical protein